jgi:dynein heavy chain
MKQMCIKYFTTEVIPLPDDPILDRPPVLMFGDFMQMGAAAENKVYEELTNVEKLKCVLQVLFYIYIDIVNILNVRSQRVWCLYIIRQFSVLNRNTVFHFRII